MSRRVRWLSERLEDLRARAAKRRHDDSTLPGRDGEAETDQRGAGEAFQRSSERRSTQDVSDAGDGRRES